MSHLSVKASGGAPGIARVGGKKACRIPGGMMKLVAATCSQKYSGTSALFEPLESVLPARLLASLALVRVENGIADILVIDLGCTNVLLYP